MAWRGNSNNLKFWKNTLFTLLPFALAGSAWQVHQWQKPIVVKLGPQFIASRVLFERMSNEARKHPYSRLIEIEWSRPWPKESGLNLSFSQGLQLDRSKHTLFYSTEQFGWVYTHAENSGLEVLAKAHLDQNPVTLPVAVHAQLRARGWTLTEHHLP